MQMPTQGQVLAFGRHIVSYAAGGVTAISMVHLWQNPTDAQAALDAINKVGHGFSEIVAGITTLTALGMGVVAAAKASPIVQILSGAASMLRGKLDPKKLSSDDQKTIMEATGTLPKVSAVVTTDPIIALNTSPAVVLKP